MADAAESKGTPRKYGGLTPDERKQQRRERLLAAALESFGTRGYPATAIEKLCADAGVTARHFYEEFDGRETVLVTIYESIIGELHAAVREGLVGANGSAEERIEKAVRALFEVMLADARKARIVTIEVVGVSPEMEQRRRTGAMSLARMLALTIPVMRPDLRSGDPILESTAIVIVGGVKELVVDWLNREERRAPEEVADDLVRIFISLVRGFPG